MEAIQGQDCVLSFFNNAFVPFVCASDVIVEINSENQSVRTINDGHWDKNKYSSLNYTISLSGVLVFDTNFTGWDLITNQLGFAPVGFRCTFTGQDGSIKSVQGTALIDKSTLTASIGQVVRNDFSFKGDGALMYFDGLIPCDSSIQSIGISGQTGADGTVSVTYTYTGTPYQVKYRLNGVGPWSFALIGQPITIPVLPVGNYTIEVVPICINGYEGISGVTSFTVTHALTCAVVVSMLNASVSAGVVTVGGELNSDPAGTILKWTINGGASWNIISSFSVPFGFTISGLPVGSYTIEVVPVCANGVDGTGESTTFNIPSTPSTSTINWTYTVFPPGSILLIYKNGVLMVSQADSSGSGSFSAVATDSILAVLSSSTVGRSGTLETEDQTSSTIINNQSFSVTSSPQSINFTFSPSGGHSYLIDAIVSA